MASHPEPMTLASLANLPSLSAALDVRAVGGFLAGLLLCSGVSLLLSPSFSPAPSSSSWDPQAPYTDRHTGSYSDTSTATSSEKRPFFQWATLVGAKAAGTPGGHPAHGQGLPGGETVCWASANNGGYGDPRVTATAAHGTPSDSDGPDIYSDARAPYSDTPALFLSQGGVVIHGRGCQVCVAGSVCSFVISIRPPAQWLPSLPPQKWELMVHLYGPSIQVADIRQLPPIDGSGYIVSYVIWDPGRYRVVVRSSCNALNYTPSFQTPEARLMAQWDATVYASEPPPGTPQGGLPLPTGGSSSSVGGGPAGSREGASAMTSSLPMTSAERGGQGGAAVLDPRPCANAGSLLGRWLRDQSGNYSWQPFPCATALDVGDWIPELNRAGVHEINFVGDSHQRTMMHHLLYLVNGRLDWAQHQAHWDLSYTARHPDGGSLKLNLYFIRGIYVAEDLWNCHMADRPDAKPSRPELSPTADVTVAEAGYWTGVECERPEFAFTDHLPLFFRWLEDEGKRTQRARAPLLVYRATPPRDTEGSNCSPMTNVFIRHANELAQNLCLLADAVYFDSWHIEAARYMEHCPNEHHFSCVRENSVWGSIGAADISELVHFILPSGVPQKVFKSAVCIIPPETVWGPIQEVRAIHDKNFRRWMPHINLLYPFWEDAGTNFQEAAARMTPELESLRPFEIPVERFSYFRHARSCTVWVDPGPAAEGPLAELQSRLEALFPECNDLSSVVATRFQPHLSLGQWRTAEDAEAFVAELSRTWVPQRFLVDRIALISRRGYKDPFRVKETVLLGRSLL